MKIQPLHKIYTTSTIARKWEERNIHNIGEYSEYFSQLETPNLMLRGLLTDPKTGNQKLELVTPNLEPIKGIWFQFLTNGKIPIPYYYDKLFQFSGPVLVLDNYQIIAEVGEEENTVNIYYAAGMSLVFQILENDFL